MGCVRFLTTTYDVGAQNSNSLPHFGCRMSAAIDAPYWKHHNLRQHYSVWKYHHLWQHDSIDYVVNHHLVHYEDRLPDEHDYEVAQAQAHRPPQQARQEASRFARQAPTILTSLLGLKECRQQRGSQP